MSGTSTAWRPLSASATRCASCRRWRAAEVAALRAPRLVPRAQPEGARTGAARHAHEPAQAHDHAHAHAELAPHGGRYESILEAIGHTPLVAVPRMSPNPDVRIYAKLEMVNPTGSVKDRAARALVEDLEERGAIGPDSIILEPTSGNTGIALAMIARRKGYRIALVMPDNVTPERRQMAALFGAEIIDSPAALGSNGAISLAKDLAARDSRFVMPYQYGNPANPRAHEETTGPEILADCPEVDVVVAGLGTGGTLMGIARFFREAKPGVRIVAAEPIPGESVQGLRSLDEGFVPEILDPSLLDAKLIVSHRDAIAAVRDLIALEGIFAGPSSGAVLVAAARIARQLEAGTIVAILPDGGWKYLSAGTYARDFDEMESDLEGGINWW
ncbi:MAG: cysteine synthase family protein [Chloroflexota bacterium]|nr:MAG: cysteine synthase family protein [Chloroflexota bacterium]